MWLRMLGIGRVGSVLVLSRHPHKMILRSRRDNLVRLCQMPRGLSDQMRRTFQQIHSERRGGITLSMQASWPSWPDPSAHLATFVSCTRHNPHTIPRKCSRVNMVNVSLEHIQLCTIQSIPNPQPCHLNKTQSACRPPKTQQSWPWYCCPRTHSALCPLTKPKPAQFHPSIQKQSSCCLWKTQQRRPSRGGP